LVSASVRGIGVAVMTKTCGLYPFGAKWRVHDAKAVLLVNDGEDETVEGNAFLDQGMSAMAMSPRLSDEGAHRFLVAVRHGFRTGGQRASPLAAWATAGS